MRIRRVVRTSAAVLSSCALAASMAGCVSDDGDNAKESPGGAGELTKINLAVLANNAVSTSLVLGAEKGVFEEHGLEVTIEPVEATALIPGVMSGDTPFALFQAPGVLAVRANKLPVVHVGLLTEFPDDTADSPMQIVSAADSGIESPEDLEGKSVAIDALFLFPHLAVLNSLASKGVDTSTIEFTEVPFANMADALANGQVDAITTIDPFLTESLAAGDRAVLQVAEGNEDVPAADVITSEQFAGSDPDTVKAFQDALVDVAAYATDHEDQIRATTTDWAGVPENQAATLRLYKWTSEFNEDGWETWRSILMDQGVIKDDVSVDDAIFQGE